MSPNVAVFYIGALSGVGAYRDDEFRSVIDYAGFSQRGSDLKMLCHDES